MTMYNCYIFLVVGLLGERDISKKVACRTAQAFEALVLHMMANLPLSRIWPLNILQGLALASASLAWAGKCKSAGMRGSPRIRGGTEVKPPHKYPFMVNLKRQAEDGVGSHICGGSVLSDRIVLTAAHCINYSGLTQWVFAGVHRENEIGGWEEDAQARNRTWLLQHEKYNLSINVDHDVGLIMVDPPFIFNEKVAPIRLSNHTTPPNTELTVMGWGSTMITYPSALLEAPTKSLTYEEAQSWFNTTLTNVNIVAMKYFNVSPCFGDSGGPLYNSKLHEVVGIVSRGNDFFEAECKGPEAFTNVSHYYNWIMENKAKLESLFSPGCNETND